MSTSFLCFSHEFETVLNFRILPARHLWWTLSGWARHARRWGQEPCPALPNTMSQLEPVTSPMLSHHTDLWSHGDSLFFTEVHHFFVHDVDDGVHLSITEAHTFLSFVWSTGNWNLSATPQKTTFWQSIFSYFSTNICTFGEWKAPPSSKWASVVTWLPPLTLISSDLSPCHLHRWILSTVFWSSLLLARWPWSF